MGIGTMKKFGAQQTGAAEKDVTVVLEETTRRRLADQIRRLANNIKVKYEVIVQDNAKAEELKQTVEAFELASVGQAMKDLLTQEGMDELAAAVEVQSISPPVVEVKEVIELIPVTPNVINGTNLTNEST